MKSSLLWPLPMIALALCIGGENLVFPASAQAQESASTSQSGSENRSKGKMAGKMEGRVAENAEAAKPLSVDSKAPDATLTTVEGKSFKLGAALRKQPTVLIFYRGGWCPFCNKQLADLHTIVGDLKGLGYQLLAVSMDRPEELRKTIDKQHLDYTLLSDSDAVAVKAYGVAFKVDDATIEKYKTYNVDLEKASGHDHHILPVPSVFVIGRDRTIRFVHSNPDYRVRLSADKVLEAARAAKSATGHAHPHA